MGLSYSYPASHLSGSFQDPRLSRLSQRNAPPRGLTTGDAELLKAMEELALTNEAQKQFAEAAQLREHALSIFEDSLGTDNPTTLKALRILSIVYERQGEHQKSDKLYDQVFKNPKSEPSVDAMKHWEQALETRREILGEEHPATLSSTNKLSQGYKTLGRRNEAFQLDKKVYDTWKRVLGDRAPATILSAERLSESYTHLGQLREAIQLEEMIATNTRQTLGVKHHDTQRAMENLSRSYNSVGWHVKAAELQEIIVRFRVQSLGEEHPATIQSQHILVQYYRNVGREHEAVEVENKTRSFLQARIGSIDIGPKFSANAAFAQPSSEAHSIQIPSSSDTDGLKQMMKVYSPIQDQWHPVVAILDDSTSKNWISSNVINPLQLIAHSEASKQYLAFNGSTFESNSIVIVRWCDYENQSFHKTEFHSIEEAPFDVLFGTEFLFSEAISSFTESPQSFEEAGAENNRITEA